ncbi:C4-dicarboxylate transporter DcuC [Enterocloster lavalensis]|uniref:C4-dicarboxylate transporter DcuC n=1 Tax=Enterocloster lavalensis TaxID=460384 RepID=UPI0023F36660|nr:C4-dicarboxylate transporter DcuC [Enterocloster lavalensis]
MSFLGIAIAILVLLGAGGMIFKKYKAQAVFLGAGLIMIIAAHLLGITPILSEEKSTGFWLIDAFDVIRSSLSSTASGLGMIIMSVGGYATYMDHIGAGEAMVKICINPLKKLGSPYIVLALAYTVGQILNIFIPSAAGLAILLMATIYPVLVSLGVSPIAAVSVITTTACLDLGPASGASNIASETAGISAMNYFVKYQMMVAIPVIIVITIAHYFIQKYADKKMNFISVEKVMEEKRKEKAPVVYAVLPLIPLLLLLVFNEFVISTISIDVITAMLIGLFVSILFEIAVKRNVREVFKGMQSYFDGMGKQFATVITLIVAAGLFAKGLQSIGLIDAIINHAQNLGFGAAPMTVIMVAIISATAFVTGSGNAAFVSFAALAPVISESFHVDVVVLLMAMQLAAGIARSFSPVASCVIAPSAYADVPALDVARRNLIPMIAGIVVLVIADFVLFL